MKVLLLVLEDRQRLVVAEWKFLLFCPLTPVQDFPGVRLVRASQASTCDEVPVA